MSDDTEAYARGSDPSTSHEAAERARHSDLEWKVFEVLASHWPRYMTSIEVAEELEIDKWSISPRFAPLERKGLVECMKVAALNSSGKVRSMLAWRARFRRPLG